MKIKGEYGIIALNMAVVQELDVKESLRTVIHHDIEKPVPVDLDVSPGCEALTTDYGFHFVLMELIHNCTEKKAEDITVHVTIGFNHITEEYDLLVEDNVQYDPAKADDLVNALNAGKINRSDKNRPKTSADAMEEFSGIRDCRAILEKYHGALEFLKSKDHRILAHARWKK